VEADVLTIHSKLTARAQKLDIDVPPLTDGSELLMEVIRTLPKKRSGDR
jgi:hypothetical protein